jgi:hypothetical protein
VFTETASGARTDRPTLEQLLDQLRPGDTLVVWKLDRLGRSLCQPVDSVTGLAERGVGFRSLQEAIDTTTPGGKLVFHVFAALAEFERDLIRERTTAGLAAARARGRHGGRPSVMTAHKVRVAGEMYASGQYTVSAIATTLGSAGPRSTATWGAQAALYLGKKFVEVDKVDDLLDPYGVYLSVRWFLRLLLRLCCSPLMQQSRLLLPCRRAGDWSGSDLPERVRPSEGMTYGGLLGRGSVVATRGVPASGARNTHVR